MAPELTQIVQRLQEAQHRVHRLAAAVDADRWGTRTSPDRWSVGECVEHLNLTSAAYLPALDDGLRRARAEGGAAPGRLRLDPVGWLLVRMTGPIPRLGGLRFGRTRTAPAFVPTATPERDAGVAEFDRLQAQLIELVQAGDGLPLDRVRIPSPFDARVRYSLYSALAILPGHQHRHLEQAEAVWSNSTS